MQQRKVALLGYGAIGQEIIKSCRLLPFGPQISTVVVRASACKETARDLGSDIQVSTELPSDVNLLIECAGHEAVKTTVLDALRSGVESAIVTLPLLSALHRLPIMRTFFLAAVPRSSVAQTSSG